MSSGFGTGDKRVSKAIQDALNSPLLNNNDVFGAKKVLLNLYFSEDSQIKMEEINEVNEFMLKFGKDVEVIWGAAFDNALEETVKITILATGFGISNVSRLSDRKKPGKEEGEPNKTSRLTQVYGGDSIKEMERSKARASFVILSVDQMDDDSLLEQIDKSPTYNRDPQFLSRIMRDNKEPDVPSASSDGVIRF